MIGTEGGPAFPALCISRCGFLTGMKNREALETCGESALRSGYFTGLLLVDPAGRSWEVRSAEKVANVGPLGGYRLFRSRRIRVRLDLVEGPSFDLDKLKDRMCEAIDQVPLQWEALEDSGETKGRVRSMPSILGLIELFLEES